MALCLATEMDSICDKNHEETHDFPNLQKDINWIDTEKYNPEQNFPTGYDPNWDFFNWHEDCLPMIEGLVDNL